nr:type II secretion system protein GspL [Pseudomonas aeruginosa]
MKATWRCLLPPLSEFAEAAPLHCLRLDARGAVQERIEASLAELARRRQGLPVALFLHPRDCRLVSLELPALPAAKLAAAVNCAAEALVLGAWLGERPAWGSAALERAEALDEALRWSGPASPWGLALKAPATSAGNGTWKMPLVCAALALLVWVAGLNLYAGQLAGQGQSLQRQSSQRVQQAFPELPVVLDPLRQARERRDAYLAGKADGDAVPGLAALLHGAGEAMPFLAGRLQRLDYHAGELDLELLPGPPGGDAAAWQGELGKHGLQADASDKGWQVRAMEAPPAPAAGAAGSGTAEAAADEDE